MYCPYTHSPNEYHIAATGCVELGYTDGCCELGGCTLNLPGTADDCFCNELCYSLENCCQDILHSCPPREKKHQLYRLPLYTYIPQLQNYYLCIFPTAADANLCAMFRGYNCDLNAQCLSVGNEVNNSASYQCVCNQGYIGDGNTTCLG